MKPGDVVWVDFPLRGGHAQAGRRPAIVLQSETANALLPTILLVPLTTQQDALRFPGTILVEASEENGLTKPSIALAFQITVADKRFVNEPTGHVSVAVMESIWSAFDEITDRVLAEGAADT